MISLPEEKILYSEIQKKLFYIIPEKWESIYSYASVIDVPGQKPVGEMYFYYLPKGIIKKKYVNGYEIPSIFNIDEEQYSKLITDVYNKIKLLRERAGMNQDELCEGICERTFLSKLENGCRKAPSIVMLSKLCQKLNISMDDLFLLSFGDNDEILTEEEFMELVPFNLEMNDRIAGKLIKGGK